MLLIDLEKKPTFTELTEQIRCCLEGTFVLDVDMSKFRVVLRVAGEVSGRRAERGGGVSGLAARRRRTGPWGARDRSGNPAETAKRF
jgi:hypothetical protein